MTSLGIILCVASYFPGAVIAGYIAHRSKDTLLGATIGFAFSPILGATAVVCLIPLLIVLFARAMWKVHDQHKRGSR